MLELKFIQRMDLNLEYYTTESICDAICELSPLGKKGIRRRDVLEYLDSVNNKIDDFSSEKLGNHILTASGIYIFVDPLLHIVRDPEDEKIRDRYKSLLSDEPYNLESPLHPYFQKSNQDQFIIPEDIDLITVTDDFLSSSVSFSRSGNFTQQIVDELAEVTKLLSRSKKKETYTRAKHFAFVGYYDICRHLFSVSIKKKHYQSMSCYLRDTFGNWMIQAPDLFEK
jgi:hypothetical protein